MALINKYFKKIQRFLCQIMIEFKTKITVNINRLYQNFLYKMTYNFLLLTVFRFLKFFPLFLFVFITCLVGHFVVNNSLTKY